MSLLAGKRILITRPLQHNEGLQSLFAEQGAHTVAFPTIAIVPDPAQQARLDHAIGNIKEYDWILFTSQNAVALFWERIENAHLAIDMLEGVKIAAIGPATERALQAHGISVRVVPDEYVGEAVASSIGDVRGQKVLLPRAQAAREELVTQLIHQGAIVDEIPLYHTVTNQPEPAAWKELKKGIDYVTFTSASTVHGFFALLGADAHRLLEHAAAACIGPVTAEALAEHGRKAQIIANQYTAQGLVEAVLAYAVKNEHEVNG